MCQALVAYLQKRPADAPHREVFLQVRADSCPMNSSAVTQVMTRNAARVGLGTVRAHRLRHSATRAVLAERGTLVEVGELLSHSTGWRVAPHGTDDPASGYRDSG